MDIRPRGADVMCSNTMRIELALLTLWYILFEESEAKGYCTFPAFLWEPMADGSERQWIGRTEYYLNTDKWQTQKEIIAQETEIIVHQKVHEPCSRHSHRRREHHRAARNAKEQCYREDTVIHIICISEEPDGKFRVQQTGNGESMFSCLKFFQRNKNVVQVYQAVAKDVNEDRLCYDESLQRDEWPWIVPMQESWSYCPMEGGFDFTAYYGTKRERLCPDEWRPSRLESECVRGEGAVLYFPRTECSPFENQRSEQGLQCWASWEENNYKFVMFGEERKQPRYVLRLPSKVNLYDEFSSFLYLSPVLPASPTGEPPGTVSFLEFKMLRSEPGVCYDESDLCRQYALEGKCTNSALHRYANYCKRSCGLCDFAPSPRAECKFPDEFLGDWVLFSPQEREEISIEAGDMRFSTLGRFICKSKHWEDSFYKVFSVFNNGCRPRYSCVELSHGSGDTLDFRLSRSSSSDRSFHLCHFADDPLPLGGLIRSYDPKMLLPIRTMFYGSCGIGGQARAEVTFSDGRRCDGTIWDVNLNTCDPKSKMLLNLPSCAQKKADFLCSAFTRFPDGESLLVTQAKSDRDNHACWLIKEVKDEKAAKKGRLPVIEYHRAHCDYRHPLYPSKASKALTVIKVHRDLADRPCGRFQDQAKDAALPHLPQVIVPSTPVPISTKPPPPPSRPFLKEPSFSHQGIYVHHHQEGEDDGGSDKHESANGALGDEDDTESDEDGYFIYDPEDFEGNEYLIEPHNKNNSRPPRTDKNKYFGSRHVSAASSEVLTSWTLLFTSCFMTYINYRTTIADMRL